MNILEFISNAQIATAAVYPSSAYTGGLPTSTVKKGSKGANVKQVQTFLNWCIKSGLAVDGYCGSKTVAAIKKYQKQYKLKVDGIFGSQSRNKAKTIIAKYAPKQTTATPVQTTASWVDKANAWAKKIAADNTYHYVKWSSNTKTHECPICHKHANGAYKGWNCIGFAYSVLYHGAGINIKHSNGVINNAKAESILKAKTDADATKIVRQALGSNDFVCIKRKAGISKASWKAGDICLKFNGNTYVHTFYYMGNGKICDSTSAKSAASQIAVRDYKNYSCKVIIRYTGK